MFNCPLVLGIDSRSLIGNQYTLSNLMDAYGYNTGNMLFSEALYQSLSNSKRCGYHFDLSHTENVDVIVIAAANWLNEFDDFGWLAELISATNIPVVMVGIGAQSQRSESIPRLKDGTIRLLDVVKERSTSISTRGGFSSEVLWRYGVKNTQVTGCPSLLLCGSSPAPILKLSRIIPPACAIHSTRHLYSPAEEIHAYLYRQSLKQDIPIILQSELADIYYTLDRTQNQEIVQLINPILTNTYGAPIEAVSQYLKDYSHIFFELEHWIEYLAKRQFCFGTRLHGCVASLIAGTPVTLITHDTRTIEAAQVMGIPYLEGHNLRIDRDIELEEIYDLSDQERFLKAYGNYYQNFQGFFAVNRLRVN